MKHLASGTLAFGVALLPFTGSAAQSVDPVEAAARHVLEERPTFQELGPRLLVDTAGYGYLDDVPLSPAARQAARRLAAEWGARPGRIADVMVCPDSLPVVDPFPQTCRLVDGLEAVLQVSDVADAEGGPAVGVITWVFQENADRGTYHVDATVREVRLARTGEGLWRVVGVRKVSSAMF